MTEGEFREAVNQAPGDVGVEYRIRGADELLRILRPHGADPTEEDVERALGLARQFAAAEAGEHETSVPLSPTAYSRETARLWARLLKPWAEDYREKTFGKPEPPFDATAWTAAAEWIEDQVVELEKPAGPHRAHQVRSFRYYGRDGSTVEEVQLKGHPAGLEWRGLVPAIVTLANLARAFHELSGISQAELVRYVLAGVRPELPRVRIRGETRFHQLPDGTQISGRRVTVDFLTPDVTWRELRELHRDLRRMWTELGIEQATNGPKKTPRLTPKDRRLLDVVGELGGIPDQPTGEWWEAVDEEWRRRGFEPRTNDAHRIHWSRLQEKLEAPGVSPEGEIIRRTDLP